MAIEKGQIKQIEQFDDVSEGEDIIWLRGSNQGKEKCNTYLATKCNGLFEKSNNSEQGKYEMGMGVPETGNSGWGVMLSVTESGVRRGFSFEKRGRAYTYVEDWMVSVMNCCSRIYTSVGSLHPLWFRGMLCRVLHRSTAQRCAILLCLFLKYRSTEWFIVFYFFSLVLLFFEN